MRRLVSCSAIAVAMVLSATACSTSPHCGAGYSPEFELTVRSSHPAEPSVRFCDAEQCSPEPSAGPIPKQYLDQSQDSPALVVHVAQGQWRISPRGRNAAPRKARIELYENGQRIATSIVSLEWPDFDPCAANNPPAPHPTVSAP